MKKISIVFLLIIIFCLTLSAKNFFKKLEETLKEKTSKEETKEEVTEDTSQIQTIEKEEVKEEKDNKLSILKKIGVKEKDLKIISATAGVIKSKQEISLEEEKSIGGSLAIETVNRFNGPYENEIINLYVNLVGQTIAKYCDRTEITYHFLVLDSEEINAFAAPGGYIFITKGLLKIVDDESQLAGVLAHEIAHITEKHILKSLQRGKFLENLTTLGATIANKDISKYSKIMNQVNELLFEKGLDQSMEYEADKIAIDIVTRVGYRPDGLYDFLLNLKKQLGEKKSIFFSTHPSINSRIDKLNEILLNNYKNVKGEKLSKRFLSYKKLIE